MEFDKREEQMLDLSILVGDILRQARQMLVMGVVLMLICSVFVGARSYRAYTPVYEASASFTVRVANPLYASISSYNIKTAEQMAKTFPYILTSGVLRERVQDALGCSYLPSIQVSAAGNTSVITITVQDKDPKFAHDVLDAVITYYPEVAEFVVGPTVLLMLDESGVPTSPVTRFRFFGPAVKGALLGAAIWATIVVLWAVTRNTIHNEDELRRVLNTPCIGHLPSVKLNSRQSCPIVRESNDRSGFSESVRLLCLRVEKKMAEYNSKVLLVSSAIPGEGKTTLSVNLALAMAKKGKKVLLIDCDIYNPSVTKVLQIRNSDVLWECLSGLRPDWDTIGTTDYDNLMVYAGSAGANKNQRQNLRERIAHLISISRDRFDYVILDTPPCSLLADAAEISDLAECGLMVIRQDFASWDQILDGARSLNEGNLKLVGCVLNNMKRNVSGSYGTYYGYGYGNGYGYGYGYGNGSETRDD